MQTPKQTRSQTVINKAKFTSLVRKAHGTLVSLTQIVTASGLFLKRRDAVKMRDQLVGLRSELDGLIQSLEGVASSLDEDKD